MESDKSVPADFLRKTYELVDDPSTNDIVSWRCNDTFVIWRPEDFTCLLRKYFKHNKILSFERQLYRYGFKKVVGDRLEFRNEFFRKGKQHLLCEIEARKTSQAMLSRSISNLLSSPSGVAPPAVGVGGPGLGMEMNFFAPQPAMNRADNVSVLLNDFAVLLRNLYKTYNAAVPLLLEASHTPATPTRIMDTAASLNACSQCFPMPSHSKDLDPSPVDESFPKLFGVPLHGNKRLHPDSWEEQSEEFHVTQPYKVLKTDLTLNLMPPSDDPPADHWAAQS